MTTVWIIFLLAFTMAGAGNVYHNQFAVQVKGGNEAADKVAERHGLENKGQIGNLNDHFLFESHKLEKRFFLDLCHNHLQQATFQIS